MMHFLPHTLGNVTLRKIEPADLKFYQELFNNEQAMEKYLGGPRDITQRFHNWLGRWKLHDFSAIAVCDLSDRIIGHVVLGHGDYAADLKGWSEVAIVIHPDHWKSGHGTSTIRAVCQYANWLLANGKGVPSDVTDKQTAEVEELVKNHPDYQVHRDQDGNIRWIYLPLHSVIATSRRDNEASHRIFQRVFINEHGGSVKPHNGERDVFTLNLLHSPSDDAKDSH